MATVKTVSANTRAQDIIKILKDDGCVVIEGLIEKDNVKKVQSDLKEQFAKTPDCSGDFYGYKTKRFGSLFTKSPVFSKMATLPVISKIMDAFLLPGCEQYQINLTQAISIGANEDPQIIHQDDPMFPFMHPDHEVMVNCMWAIDDFTIENGATQLVPGSHKWERVKVIDPEKMRLPKDNEITQGVMTAGSVLIYLGSLYHSGGQNKTNTSRRGAVISYSLGWLRQAENSYLAYSQEEVSKMPERLQRLLGYFVHSPNLGSVNGRDPIELLSNEGSSDITFTEFIPEEAQKILRQYKEQNKKVA